MSSHIGNRLPAPLRFDLGALSPPGAIGQAILLTTIDADGSPRIAVLAAGEIQVPDDRRLEIDIHENSATCKNLIERKKAALWCVLDAAAYTVKAEADAMEGPARDGRRRFGLAVESVWRDFEPTAPMAAGPTYRRNENAD